MNYWQIANGDDSRDYSSIFLRYGVAFIGPGNIGPIDVAKNIPRYEEIGRWKDVKPILELKAGDRIILKNGRREMLAAGEVVKHEGSIYNYSHLFGDIDGWNLQHFVKVRWKKIACRYEKMVFSISTLQGMNSPKVRADIEALWKSSPFLEAEELPKTHEKDYLITYEDVEQHLIDNGMRVRDAETTSHIIRQIEKLAKWYISNKINASEHEIRTFLVVPFLQALGWSPQKIGIEKNKIDILLYEDHERQKPSILIETKSMWSGSLHAVKQAQRYIHSVDIAKNINQFIVTDGLRYWLYKREAESFKASAYMNFRNKRSKYPIYREVDGMLHLLETLSPIL